MADLTKNIVTLLTLVLFILGTGITMYGIFKSNELSEKQLDETFIIPSQVLNGLTVMFLLYLTATNTIFSPSYKLLIIFLLVGGMIIEIYLTSYADKTAESIAAYVFVILNFLIRAFFLIDLTQSEWIKPFTDTVKPMQQAVKETIIKTLEPATTVEERPSMDEVNKYKDQWRSILKDVNVNNADIDRSTITTGWRVIEDASKAGELTKENLKEALSKIKKSDGTAISGVSIGGRRRS